MKITLADISGMSADQLRQAERELAAELADLHVGEHGEARDLTPDEQTRFDELTRLHDRVRAHQRVRDQFDRGNYETAYGRGGDRPTREGDQLRSKALRVLEQRGKHLDAEAGDRVDALIRSRLSEENRNMDGSVLAQRILLTENDTYQRAFARILEAGMRGRSPVLDAVEAASVREFEKFEQRAMAIGDNASGGYGVPVFIDPTIILTGQQGGEYADILSVARVVPITTSEWKGVSSAGVTWAFQEEAAEVTDNSPTLAQPTVPIHMARGFIPYSIEVGMDYPNFASEMASLLAEGYLDLAGEKVTKGSGSDEPKGLITALDAVVGSEVATTTAGVIGAVDVYKVWEQLPKRARRRASWMSDTTVQNRVRQLGAAASGTADANFTIDFTQEAVTRLFGKRYLINDVMDDAVTDTTAANLLVVGSFDRFLIAQRIGMNIEPVPHLFHLSNNRPSGQRGFFAYARIGSDVTDADSFRLLQNKTS